MDGLHQGSHHQMATGKSVVGTEAIFECGDLCAKQRLGAVAGQRVWRSEISEISKITPPNAASNQFRCKGYETAGMPGGVWE
ncbi:SirA-like protein [Anopheles sinensis]|uniref:SirA-like protein n=1 Tax=Anopheles sinensis TaxID=74873 RepID=A0A084VQB1_ANOSI|nr:SirA-like protein [Anopheles sinensis]